MHTIKHTGGMELSVHLFSALVLDEISVQFHTLVD